MLRRLGLTSPVNDDRGLAIVARSLRRLLGAAGIVIALVCIPLTAAGVVELAQGSPQQREQAVVVLVFASGCVAAGAMLAWWGFRGGQAAASNDGESERPFLSLAGPDGRISEAEVILRTALSAAKVRAAAGRLCSAGLVAELPSADGARVYRLLGLPSAAAVARPAPAPAPATATPPALALPPPAPVSTPAATSIDVLVTRHGLTPAEANVLGLLSNGLTNEQIAEKLFVSPATVRTHVYNLFRKLGVRSRVQATLLVVGAPAAPPSPRTGD